MSSCCIWVGGVLFSQSQMFCELFAQLNFLFQKEMFFDISLVFIDFFWPHSRSLQSWLPSFSVQPSTETGLLLPLSAWTNSFPLQVLLSFTFAHSEINIGNRWDKRLGEYKTHKIWSDLKVDVHIKRNRSAFWEVLLLLLFPLLLRVK